MRTISGENKNTITDEEATQLYESDKQNFDDFVSGNSPTFDYAALKRLVLSELSLNNNIKPNRVMGFTRDQIKRMAKSPERYGVQILNLMDYMYQGSGYLRRLVDYFSNMPILNHYVDTEATNVQFLNVKESVLQKNYINYCALASKFNLSNIVHDIVLKLYMYDTCYAYVSETDTDISYFFLDPRACQITKMVNGNVYEFAVNRSLLTTSYIQSFPEGLQRLLEESQSTSLNNLVEIPYDQSFCLKYNTNYLYPYPPLFPMIADILLVDDYKDLAKSKAINDAYKLLVLEIPTKDGKVTMDDKMLAPYVQTACEVVQDNIGVLPYPADVKSVEFSSSNADDRDKVKDAVSEMYSEMGVSEALMSGASSGSELKLSITNDSGDIYRIYRMLEDWMNLQMKLRGFIYRSYRFIYKILDMTIFNQDDVIDRELKLSQASLPNKMKLCAAAGISPSALIGNTIMENIIFGDIFKTWNPLRSSYTESSSDDGDDVGRPAVDDTELSPAGEQTRDDEENDPDNRV